MKTFVSKYTTLNFNNKLIFKIKYYKADLQMPEEFKSGKRAIE